MSLRLLEASDTLDVVEAALADDEVVCVPAPPELVELLELSGPPRGGGGGGPLKPKLSPIDDRRFDEELAPEVPPRDDSSCCIMSSRVLARSDRLDVVDADVVDAVDPAPPAPPIPPMPCVGGGGPAIEPSESSESDWACNRLDIMPDDRLPRK